MDNGTLFYICGGALAVSAILVSFLGLKVEAFPGRAAPLVFLWFAVLVGAATSFSVLHAKDEEHAKAAEFSAESEKLEAEESQEVDAEAGHGASDEGSAKGGEARQGAQGSGVTLQLAASPTEIAYDKKSLSSRPGEVTIEFDNPAAIEHDVAIEQDGEEIAASDVITAGKTSVSADLAAGTYRFLCTVPGHAEAGMEGTLTVR